jgi:hypothetical protein
MGCVTRRMVLAFAVLPIAEARAQAGGNWVITSQEAALPLSASSKAGRAITRGPAIRQVSPAGPVAPNSPFALRVEFVGRSGEKIDPATAQITILRGNTINITQRLRAFITANGIVIPDAIVAPGTHVLQVAVSDDRGRQSLANIEIDAR